MKDILINERYRVDYKIGAGGFSLVYAGTDLELDEEVAIKLMHIREEGEVVRAEQEAYKALAGGTGIPRVLWLGQECDYYVQVHELLGPSLEDLFTYCRRRFSLKTVLLLADQAIARIQYVHGKGLLHRDIKPGNFLMGTGRKGNILYIIDFGLSQEFTYAERHQTLQSLPFGGTNSYASLNNHNGLVQSWRDDLESLGYVLLHFARGSLPWLGLGAATEQANNELIRQKKQSLDVDNLCQGLPRAFETYVNYTRSLAFHDRPDYAYLRRIFRRVFASEGFECDNVFDWTIRLYEERKAMQKECITV